MARAHIHGKYNRGRERERELCASDRATLTIRPVPLVTAAANGFSLNEIVGVYVCRHVYEAIPRTRAHSLSHGEKMRFRARSVCMDVFARESVYSLRGE